MIVDDTVTVAGSVEALDFARANGDQLIGSTTVYDVVSISQVAYDALGPGRNTGTLYLITS
jgi:hypothetical protein